MEKEVVVIGAGLALPGHVTGSYPGLQRSIDLDGRIEEVIHYLPNQVLPWLGEVNSVEEHL